jgi:hypothetical protein
MGDAYGHSAWVAPTGTDVEDEVSRQMKELDKQWTVAADAMKRWNHAQNVANETLGL